MGTSPSTQHREGQVRFGRLIGQKQKHARSACPGGDHTHAGSNRPTCSDWVGEPSRAIESGRSLNRGRGVGRRRRSILLARSSARALSRPRVVCACACSVCAFCVERFLPRPPSVRNGGHKSDSAPLWLPLYELERLSDSFLLPGQASLTRCAPPQRTHTLSTPGRVPKVGWGVGSRRRLKMPLPRVVRPSMPVRQGDESRNACITSTSLNGLCCHRQEIDVVTSLEDREVHSAGHNNRGRSIPEPRGMTRSYDVESRDRREYHLQQ